MIHVWLRFAAGKWTGAVADSSELMYFGSREPSLRRVRRELQRTYGVHVALGEDVALTRKVDE